MRENAKRLGIVLMALCLTIGVCAAEDAEEIEIVEMLEEEILLDEMWDEDPEEVLLDEPRPAMDRDYHTPNERTGTTCDHEVCFWKMNMGEMDDEAIWKVLTQPVTVLKGKQRDQVRVRLKPDDKCKEYTGVVTCASQAVHVLEKGEDWTLIEAYSSCEEGSAVKVWALPFQGYVKTSLLQEQEVSQEYGLVVDKLQQRLYVFKDGHLFSTLLCSTGFPKAGAPWNETPAGEFLLVSWTGGFWSDGGLYCDMGLRVNSGILLHEVPCIVKTNETTGVQTKDYSRCERYLGEKASHGCIRVQKELTPERVNMKWLWDNLPRKPYVKIIIWDEIDRTLEYPDDDYLLYYNPKGGKQYHSSPNCALVKEKYWPLTSFTYGELEDSPYSKLTRCPGCAPQLRREEIDLLNSKNTREP